MAPRDEQRRWEEEHIGAAALRFGARDANQRHAQKDYEYVLEEDEMIQFVNAVQMRGTSQSKVREEGVVWEMCEWGKFKVCTLPDDHLKHPVLSNFQLWCSYRAVLG